MEDKLVHITDTSLRDAHQSLWATRMRTQDMMPIIEVLDDIGFYALEMWGGATFDACLNFLNENPWDRLRVIKAHAKKTPLMMLLRGQNIVGYRHYPDDIVRRFVFAAHRNGIDIFRMFDALNDTRNLKTAIEAVLETGAHAQGAVVYTISPIHTLEHYVETAGELVEMGVHSLCIKDMAALLSPYRTYNLVKRLKKEFDLPLEVHCHYIGGMAPMNYIKAIEAGADIIDTATAPLAFGNSQPATEMIVAALKDTPYDSKLDLDKLYEIAEYFDRIREKRGFKRGVTSLAHMKVTSHQVPGGMISNLMSQLEQQKAIDRLNEVLEEIPRVRAEVGYPPLVTPLSQIVGTQAVLNILTGKRWGIIPTEMKDYVRGLYGKAPGPIDADILKLILGDEKPFTGRPAELITETYEDFAAEIGDLATSEEDVLAYALFPKLMREYLERHSGPEKAVFAMKEQVKACREDDAMDIDQLADLIKLLDESDIGEVVFEEGDTKVTLRKHGGPVVESKTAAPATQPVVESAPSSAPEGTVEVKSPMVGTFYRASSPDAPPYVEQGDTIEVGQTLCMLEAMKLFNEINAEISGKVVNIMVENAQPVEYGQTLFWIEPS